MGTKRAIWGMVLLLLVINGPAVAGRKPNNTGSFFGGTVTQTNPPAAAAANSNWKTAGARIDLTRQKEAVLEVMEMTQFNLGVDGTKSLQSVAVSRSTDCTKVEAKIYNPQSNTVPITVGDAKCPKDQFIVKLKTVEGTEVNVTFNVKQDPAWHQSLQVSASQSTLRQGESAEIKISGGTPPYYVSTGLGGTRIEKVGETAFKVAVVKSELKPQSCIILVSDSRNNRAPEVIIAVPGTGVQLPDLKGKSREEAASLLRSAGITNSRVVEEPTEFHQMAGKITKQQPPAGSWVEKSETVSLTVAGGVAVPDMLLKSEAEAVDAVKRQGLRPEVAYYPETSSGAVGKVTKSDPMPYRVVTAGSTVKLMVGRSSFDMPNLIGNPLSHASQSLDLISKTKSLNLKTTVTTKDTPNLADDGKVFDQSPKAGAALAPGSAVTLSAYRWVYPMPNFTGMTDKEAFAALNQVNSRRPGFIKMSATQTKDSANPKDQDRIHDQNPKPGTIVQPGATAIVYTYKYQPSAPAAPAAAYVVPDVVNKNEHDAAREVLKAGGKLLPTQYTLTNPSRSGRVMAQSIPAGTKTAEGVCLTVGKSR